MVCEGGTTRGPHPAVFGNAPDLHEGEEDAEELEGPAFRSVSFPRFGIEDDAVVIFVESRGFGIRVSRRRKSRTLKNINSKTTDIPLKQKGGIPSIWFLIYHLCIHAIIGRGQL